jgi:hypothetical protein
MKKAVHVAALTLSLLVAGRVVGDTAPMNGQTSVAPGPSAACGFTMWTGAAAANR